MTTALAIGLPLITGAITLAIGKSAGYAQVIERLDYDFKVETKLDIRNQNLNLKVDFWLYNPTDEKLTISYPFIMVYYDTMWVTQNQVNSDVFTLKPKSELTIPNITFDISFLKIISLIKTDLSVLLQNPTTYIERFTQKLTQTASFEVNGKPIVYKTSILGYAPLSAIDRPIKESRNLDYLFPKPIGKEEIVIGNASVKQTVAKMHEIVEQDYTLLTQATEKLFNINGSRIAISKNIFDFIFKHIKYNLEKGEQLRNPAVTYDLAQRKAREFYKQYGYYSQDYSADCDDIAIFVAAILKNLNIPYAFRIASYTASGAFSHVYVITFDEEGKEIIIDPVYHRFNAEKTPTKKTTYDKNMNTLSGIPVLYLSGSGSENIDKIIYSFLLQSRNLIARRPRHFRNSAILVQIYDYILKYWFTENREKALQIATEKEDQLRDTLAQNCNCGINEKLFFEELDGLYSFLGLNGITGLNGRLADSRLAKFAKKGFDKIIKRNYANNPVDPINTTPTNTTPTPVVPPSPTPPPVNNNNDKQSVIKTARDMVVKYKVPIALGVTVLTGGAIVATSPKIQTKLGIRKESLND